MGQDQSVVSEDTPPETLSERSIEAVADYIKSGRARHIVVMTGAGLSTAAGIPDFRTPGTGLYSNLARLNLPYAEAVFDIGYFRQNPEPFYVLAKELYPGRYHPTVSHVFITLLAAKGLLLQLFTQNIDCLERQAGVPGELIVEAHGSFATQRCIECKTEFPDDRMKEHVEKGVVPHCDRCNGLVKPDIVFFGESLPDLFRQRAHYPRMADLVIIIGTSLTVYPFAGLPEEARDTTPRVLFNMDRAGSLGTRADDVLVLGDCDSGIRKLADALGWHEELEAEWRRVVGDAEAEKQLKSTVQREEAQRDEVNRLADEVEQVLHLNENGANEESPSSSRDQAEATAAEADVVAAKEQNAEPEAKKEGEPEIAVAKEQGCASLSAEPEEGESTAKAGEEENNGAAQAAKETPAGTELPEASGTEEAAPQPEAQPVAIPKPEAEPKADSTPKEEPKATELKTEQAVDSETGTKPKDESTVESVKTEQVVSPNSGAQPSNDSAPTAEGIADQGPSSDAGAKPSDDSSPKDPGKENGTSESEPPVSTLDKLAL